VPALPSTVEALPLLGAAQCPLEASLLRRLSPAARSGMRGCPWRQRRAAKPIAQSFAAALGRAPRPPLREDEGVKVWEKEVYGKRRGVVIGERRG